MKRFMLFQEEGSKKQYMPITVLEKPVAFDVLSNPMRQEILLLLGKEALYPAQIAQQLKLHEQKVYYHLKQLLNAGLVEIAEKKEVRGTIAKKYRAVSLNFAVILEQKWKNAAGLFVAEKNKEVERFLQPLLSPAGFDCTIIVGSPDPHGQYKARSRDNYYATDLALFLGQFCTIPEHFSVVLDVDAKPFLDGNLIVIGGPVSNIIASAVNEKLPIPFRTEQHPWVLEGRKNSYNEETIGVIAKIPNFLSKEPNKWILFFAGVSTKGTKAAILGLTRHWKEVLSNYTGKSWTRIVQGFDVDADGSIDTVEVLE